MPKPLDASMDNVLATKLARCAREAAAAEGDGIDQGLVLRRLMDEQGFQITVKPGTPAAMFARHDNLSED